MLNPDTARPVEPPPPKVPAKPEPPRTSRLVKVRRIVFISVVSLAALAAIVKWTIAPWAVRHYLSGWFAERSYGKLEIAWASVGVRELVLYGVNLTDREGHSSATVDRVIVKFDRPILGYGTPAMTSLKLVHPDVSLTLDPDGHLDIEKMLRRPPEAPRPTSDPIRLPPQFDVERGLLHFKTAFLTTDFGIINSPIHVLPDKYQWDIVEGKALGGRATISGHIGREGNESWEIQLNVQGGSLKDMTRGTELAKKDLQGRVDGFLSLGRGDEKDAETIGAGWIDIEEAHLLELPVLFSVLNVLRLNLPGDSNVRACRTDFQFLGNRLRFKRFYVLTQGIALFGSGDVYLDKQRVDLEFVPRLLSELPFGFESVREAADPFTDAFTKNFLFEVWVIGSWNDPSARPMPVRILSKPIAQIILWAVRHVRKELK